MFDATRKLPPYHLQHALLGCNVSHIIDLDISVLDLARLQGCAELSRDLCSDLDAFFDITVAFGTEAVDMDQWHLEICA